MGYFLGFLACALFGLPAHAAIITVTGGGHMAVVDAVKAAKPGDEIRVSAGNYDNNDRNTPLRITSSGTASNPIVLKSAVKHAAKLGNIVFDDAAYWTLDGFEITPETPYHTSFVTIDVRGGRNVTIKNMRIHHVRMGISLKSGTKHRVEKSTIYETINASGSKHQGAHSIEIQQATNTTIRGNKLYGFMADGIQLYIPNKGTPLNRGTTRIENNIIYNTKGYCAENAIDIKGELGKVLIVGNELSGFRVLDRDNLTGKNPSGCEYSASDSPAGIAITAHIKSSGKLTIDRNEFYDMAVAVLHRGMQTIFQNNIVHDFVVEQPLWGIGGSQYAGVFNLNSRINIRHNTFVDIPRLAQTYSGSNSGATFTNNLFYDVRKTPGSNKYSHNGWFGQSERRAGTGDVTSSLGMDMDTFQLVSGSALIDKGIPLGVTTDFAGDPRPLGLAPDIGAYEF